jgi:hypothetical protein
MKPNISSRVGASAATNPTVLSRCLVVFLYLLTERLPQENKNAAKPSPSLRDASRTETLRVGKACALRLRETRRRAERGVSKTEREPLFQKVGFVS